MQLFNRKEIQPFRRKLRNQMTPAEKALWGMIRKKQLDGVRFLRQYSIGNYIVDFYTPEYKLAVELDGDNHFNELQIEYDKRRAQYLNNCGVRVLRFENFEVFKYPERTLNGIRRCFLEDPEELVR